MSKSDDSPITDDEVREAERLAATVCDMAQTMLGMLRHWQNPENPNPVPLVSRPTEAEERRKNADEILNALRGFVTLGRGRLHDEAALIVLVDEAAILYDRNAFMEYGPPRWAHNAMADERGSASFNLREPGEIVPHLLAELERRYAAGSTVSALRKTDCVRLLTEAIAIRAGLWRARAPQQGVARWLIPLFDVAVKAGLAGEAKDARSWSQTLRNRKLPPPRTVNFP